MPRALILSLGIAIYNHYVAESSVREHLQKKELVRVLDAFCLPFPGLFLYYPSRIQVPPKLKALIDFLRLSARK